MSEKFDLESKRVTEIVKLLLSAAVGSVAAFLAQAFLASPSVGQPSGGCIFLFLQGKSLFMQLVSSFLPVVAINFFISSAIGYLSYGKLGIQQADSLYGHIFKSARQGVMWGILNYTVWGTGSIFVYAIGGPGHHFPVSVFFNAAFIGGSMHLPLCTIGTYYIGEIVLSGSDVEDVYRLRKRALFRLYAPTLFGGLGSGLILGYFTTIVRENHAIRAAYILRYKLLLLTFVWFVIAYCMLFIVDQKSFTRRFFSKNNTLVVWLLFLLVWLVGLLAGIELFENVVRRHLMIAL